MDFISKNDYYKYKNNDTIFVFGCGYSIKDLSDKEISNFERFDSIAFNWFVKSEIPVKHYLIREQANIPKRQTKGEQPEDLVRLLNHHSYKQTKLIVLDVSNHTPEAVMYHKGKYEKHLDKKTLLLKDKKNKNNDLNLHQWKENIEKIGCIHGLCTMTNILHLVVNMEYKNIIFVGVDLYDSRYFWLNEKETRNSVKAKKKTYKDKHAIADTTLNLVNDVKNRFRDINMFSYNPKSLLCRILPVWS